MFFGQCSCVAVDVLAPWEGYLVRMLFWIDEYLYSAWVLEAFLVIKLKKN